MTEPGPGPEDAVDALVRAYLDRRAAEVDPGPGLDRIRASLGRPRLGGPDRASRARARWAPSRRSALAGAVAASILLGLPGVLSVRPGRAVAESVVLQASEAHAGPMDRCYRVETQFAAGPPDDGLDPLAWSRRTRLWTRGDRFWLESDLGYRRLSWGRDPEGTLWLALTPHRGVRFLPGEVPESLALRCEVLGVRLETLLAELPGNFVLRSEPGPGASTIIRAEPRGGPRPGLQAAELEVDAASKAVRRMVLTRRLRGRSVTSTFVLEEVRPPDDTRYRLEGHLQAPYRIDRREFEPSRRLPMQRPSGPRPGGGAPPGRGRAPNPPGRPGGPATESPNQERMR